MNKIELHYWLADDSHIMDAIVQNKCEHELLSITNEIASIFKVEIRIETEPLAEGGIRRWFLIGTNTDNKKAAIAVAIITSLLAAIIVTPITSSITKVTEILIERIFEDPELKELAKEKLKLEILKLKQETTKNTLIIEDSNFIKKKKSNFYDTLKKYHKVEKISFVITNEKHSKVFDEKSVDRKDFNEFILINDELDPIEIDNAVIEIISPVLKKGNYKWMGIYNNAPISFSMKSQEFKSLIQSGEIKFKNGTSINCYLVLRKKIDNEGIERIVGAEVKLVNHYFENDKPIETSEGQRQRRKKEDEKLQLSLFQQNDKK